MGNVQSTIKPQIPFWGQLLKLTAIILATCYATSVALADSPTALTNTWTEICSSCGKTSTDCAHSFDDLDYTVLSILLRTMPDGRVYLLARAPHGPTPSCDSRYSTNSLPYLKKKMPNLKDETYASFLDRNTCIAVHNIKQFKDAKGRLVQVVDKRKKEQSPSQFSRAGFSKDGSQVLIFNRQVFLLYQKAGGELTETGRCVMWVS
jgi:hypothetical protein